MLGRASDAGRASGRGLPAAAAGSGRGRAARGDRLVLVDRRDAGAAMGRDSRRAQVEGRGMRLGGSDSHLARWVGREVDSRDREGAGDRRGGRRSGWAAQQGGRRNGGGGGDGR